MIYLLAVPAFATVYLLVDRLDLRGSTFALFAALLTIAFASLHLFQPGIDVIIAACLSMALANLCAWFIDTYATKDPDESSDSSAGGLTSSRASRFCSRLTHDFAVSPRDSVFAISLIKSGGWNTLSEKLSSMTATERQGFFANLNYSSVSERALQEIINANPDSVDGHILMGHVKLCLAKRLGLQPGDALDEQVANTIAKAFKHFNSALRLQPENPEALCGLLMAKGFAGLGSEHLGNSLTLLLQHDPTHLHGVVAAARFMVRSPAQANEFVSIVEDAVDGRSDATVAMARIITHIECLAFADISHGISASQSQVVADIYQQLRRVQKEHQSLGVWQKGLANNVIAYLLQLVGDKQQLKEYLKKIDGSVSPYPWQSNSVT